LQEQPRMQMDLYLTLLSDSVETNRPKKIRWKEFLEISWEFWWIA
jgi:hypothetical protein